MKYLVLLSTVLLSTTLLFSQKFFKKKNMIINIKSAVLFAAIIFFNSCVFFDLNKESHQLKEMKIENIDISKIKDGEYIGECIMAVKTAKVRVSVKKGTITKIDLLTHDYGPGHKAEGIVNRIIEERTLDVDAVTGATKSSMVIKKAVENALLKGL
jgi:uncharacterized protein with FMN-binding domain